MTAYERKELAAEWLRLREEELEALRDRQTIRILDLKEVRRNERYDG